MRLILFVATVLTLIGIATYGGRMVDYVRFQREWRRYRRDWRMIEDALR